MHTSILNGLGPALRWLRDRRGRKQYQVADAAGITKGMLSAYETGRQRPSLETLDKLLQTLKCDLSDLHAALQIVNGRPVNAPRPVDWVSSALGAPGSAESAAARALTVDVYSALGIEKALPRQEEQALSEMLQGFHRLLRFLHGGSEPALGPTPPNLPSPPHDGGGGDGSGT